MSESWPAGEDLQNEIVDAIRGVIARHGGIPEAVVGCVSFIAPNGVAQWQTITPSDQYEDKVLGMLRREVIMAEEIMRINLHEWLVSGRPDDDSDPDDQG